MSVLERAAALAARGRGRYAEFLSTEPLEAAAAPTIVQASACARTGRLSRAAPGVLVAAALVGTGAADGAYFPPAWGWTALALLWAVALALVLGRPSLRAVELVAPAAFGALALLALAAPDGPREAQRTLVYVAAALTAPILLTRRTAAAVVPGALAGVTAVSLYSLGTRLFPERLGVVDAIAGNRLAEPLGYWNALGVFAAIAIVLAVGAAAAARSPAARMLAAATLVPLALTLYFTFSRGGGSRWRSASPCSSRSIRGGSSSSHRLPLRLSRPLWR